LCSNNKRCSDPKPPNAVEVVEPVRKARVDFDESEKVDDLVS